ncbi:AraC family transcriptional regulator [Luteibacter aegosomatis]|uniref:helix-turn-helix domain-containing protein n=1 Tax=Luteibacter aegosomatis TaxID=2911537 RepID=UPI001FFAB9AF|nr:AraC family transcriptional regulator [Luteibacter aegosomatis]UPG83930.1 AraC family transcriptional regulator [Luteibacter aegosomatis]
MRIDTSLPSAASDDGLSAVRVVQQLLDHALRQMADVETTDRDACAHYIAQALRIHQEGITAQAPRPQSGLAAWQVRTVKDVALARLDLGLSVTELAAACRLSRGYFSRAFKVTFGESPHRWRHGKRIEYACRQLSDTTGSLADIAIACGFNDQAHFTRSFKSAMGVTPHSYRKSKRVEDIGARPDPPSTAFLNDTNESDATQVYPSQAPAAPMTARPIIPAGQRQRTSLADAPVRPIRVLVVDDHPVFRAGLVAILAGSDDVSVVAEAATGQEAIALFGRYRPDVTLIDMVLPDMPGERVILGIRQLDPTARSIVVTTFGGDGVARRALHAGAQAYLLKTSMGTDLVEAIRAVQRGEHRIDAQVARQLADFQGEDVLSERELDVLRGVAAGLENKQIASRLGLSPETVKEYLSNAMAKLRASNRAHAVSIAQARGFFR